MEANQPDQEGMKGLRAEAVRLGNQQATVRLPDGPHNGDVLPGWRVQNDGATFLWGHPNGAVGSKVLEVERIFEPHVNAPPWGQPAEFS